MNIAFVKFLDAKDEPSGKTYTYIVDDSIRQKLTPGVQNKTDVYHISNESGYNYRGAKVVCIGTAVITNDKDYDFSGLKQIITAIYCGEIAYSRSDRNQDEYEARKNFDEERKKLKVAEATSDTTSNLKAYLKDHNGAWSLLDNMPTYFSSTISDEATQNAIWNVLNTPGTTTSKIADAGLTSNKLAGSSTITNAGTIKCDPNTVVGTITNAPWDATSSITINGIDTEKNYLKTVNTSKINIEEKKEKKSMFENLMKDLHFGKADPKMSIYGPAFLAQGICAKEYTAYDKATNRWMDVTDMTFDFPTFMMPVAKDNIKSGDYIGHRGPNGNYEWVRVMKIYDNVIDAESPSRHEVISILPTRNMFGFDFYTKLIVPFDMGSAFGGASASNPFGMLPMLMMMSDKDKSGSDDNSMLMAMMMMQNGAMDFASNPMMLYALMGDKGGDNSMLMAMLMSQMMQGAPTKSACDCDHN